MAEVETNRGFQLFQRLVDNGYVWYPPHYVTHPLFGPQIAPVYSGTPNSANNPLPTSTTGYSAVAGTLGMVDGRMRVTSDGTGISYVYTSAAYPAISVGQVVNYQVSVTNSSDETAFVRLRALALNSSELFLGPYLDSPSVELGGGDSTTLNLRGAFTAPGTVKVTLQVYNGLVPRTSGQTLDISNFSVVKDPLPGQVVFWVGNAVKPDVPRYPY